MREYPRQGFAKVLGKLRCRCCKKDLPVIKSSIEAHIKTGKHISNLKKQEASDKSDKAFSMELTDYYSKHVDEKGASISPETGEGAEPHDPQPGEVFGASTWVKARRPAGPQPGVVAMCSLVRVGLGEGSVA